MIAQSFPIARSTRVCHVTGRPLVVGQRTVAVLIDAPSAGPGPAAPTRLDFDLDAWNALPDHRHVDACPVLAFWRATVADPKNPKPKPVLDDDALGDLFEQTAVAPEGATPERHAALRFVLTLLMLRRRLLVVEDSSPGLLRVRHRGDPRPPVGPALIDIVDPNLNEAGVAQVLAELEGDTASPDAAAKATTSDAAP
jgi:hypothetical protein